MVVLLGTKETGVQAKQRPWCWLGDGACRVLVTDFIFNKSRFVTLVSQ